MTIRSSPKRGNPRVADRDQERKPGLALFLDDGGDLSYSDQFPRGRGRVCKNRSWGVCDRLVLFMSDLIGIEHRYNFFTSPGNWC
jgi:hypothetical protein